MGDARPRPPRDRLRAAALPARCPSPSARLRAGIYLGHEATVLGTIVEPPAVARGSRRSRAATCARQVRRPRAAREAHARTTRSAASGSRCRTPTTRALTQPNAEVVTDPIREVRAHSIVTADGTEREVDTIILGTGFQRARQPGVRARPRPRRPHAGRGLAGQPARVPGHRRSPASPTSSCSSGPNSAGGYNSIIFTTEAHINYALARLRTMDSAGCAPSRSAPRSTTSSTARPTSGSRDSVWNEGGCASWYLDANGRNGVWWPGFTWRLWQRTRRFDSGDTASSPPDRPLGRGRTGARRVHGALDFRAVWGGVAWQRSRQRLRV